MSGRVLARICYLLATDYPFWHGGMPDLFLWRRVNGDGDTGGDMHDHADPLDRWSITSPSSSLPCDQLVGLWVEVKGPRDHLSARQQCWLKELTAASISTHKLKDLINNTHGSFVSSGRTEVFKVKEDFKTGGGAKVKAKTGKGKQPPQGEEEEGDKQALEEDDQPQGDDLPADLDIEETYEGEQKDERDKEAVKDNDVIITELSSAVSHAITTGLGAAVSKLRPARASAKAKGAGKAKAKQDIQSAKAKARAALKEEEEDSA